MKLAWNILSTLSARVLQLGAALVSSVVLARLLGPEGRGLFALVLLLPEFAKSFAFFGFEQANAVYAGLEPGGRRALVWHSAAVAAVLGGVIALGGAAYLAAGAPGFHSLLRGPLWLYLLAFATLPGGLVIEYWQAIIRGMNRILLLNLVEVGTKVASLLFALLFLAWLRLNVAGAVWASFITNVGTVVLLVALLMRLGVLGKPSFDRSLWWRTTRFALPAHGGTVAAYLNYRADEFIIAALLPPEQLAFYVIAVGIVERIWILPGSVGTALLPHLTNSRQRDPALAAAICRHVVIWVGAGCLLVFAIASPAVRILYSSAFAPAVAPLRWLLPGVFTLSIGKVLVAELFAQRKPVYTVWASGFATIVNIAGNLVLVPRMGISGAAVASSISYTVLSLMLTWYYLRETRVPWRTLLPRRSDLLVYVALWRRVIHGVPLLSDTVGGVQP